MDEVFDSALAGLKPAGSERPNDSDICAAEQCKFSRSTQAHGADKYMQQAAACSLHMAMLGKGLAKCHASLEQHAYTDLNVLAQPPEAQQVSCFQMLYLCLQQLRGLVVPADRDLKIVQGIRGLLRAGIAMHHSGLLPILKEVIEILFQEGLVKVHPRAHEDALSKWSIQDWGYCMLHCSMNAEASISATAPDGSIQPMPWKSPVSFTFELVPSRCSPEKTLNAAYVQCLFATETFAMGLNMPAKTVIFTAVKKFDGQEQRWITSGEYIQASWQHLNLKCKV